MPLNFNRRTVLKTGAAATAFAAAKTPVYADGPKKGGTLKLGMGGANTQDSWDGRTHQDSYMINMGHGCVFDCMTEVAADGSLKGELAESWEASTDAKTWTFNLRKGVEFHNGKSFGADDVLETFALHVGEESKSPAKPIIAAITEMKKMNDHQVQFTLGAGNADFPYLLSDYHILIHPAGGIEESIAKGIGTGAYKNENFEPGVRCLASRNENDYRDDRGWFDSIEAIAINDTTARMNAMMTGQIDAINKVDFATMSHRRGYRQPALHLPDARERGTLRQSRCAQSDQICIRSGRIGCEDPARSRRDRQRSPNRPCEPILRIRSAADCIRSGKGQVPPEAGGS